MVNKILLEGKVALVTGGSRGIGRGICEKLASSGCSIVVNYRESKNEAQEVCRKLSDFGRHMTIQTDVSSLKDVNGMYDQVMTRYGRLDILVNNAGWTRNVSPHNLNDLDEGIIDRMIGTNLKSVFFCSRRAIDEMKKTQQIEGSDWRGDIINISSNAVNTLSASNIIYTATKASTNSITRSLAKYYGHVARINAIAPGLNRTELTSDSTEDRFDRVREKTPLGRLSVASDVADCVLALITQMTFVTGQLINVDGGRILNG